jgi:hypothetical protein
MAHRGVKPGSRHPDAGRRKPRHKPQQKFAPLPDYPVRRAMSGEVTEEEWAELRVETWERWLTLVTTPDDGEWLAWRQAYWRDPKVWSVENDHLFLEPERNPQSDYLPQAARFDGLEGRAIASWHDQRSTVGPSRQREWAEQDLEDLASFRERAPDTAREIEAPLAHYEALLREVVENPECRGLKPGKLPGDS